MSDFAEFAAVGEATAREAGKLLLDYQGTIRAREKGPRDLVTEADLASQQLIRKRLLTAFPEHGFIGEETEAGVDAQRRPFTWIVDPLDGTANYVHGLQNFSVSMALCHHGEPLLGVVFDPVMDELFLAARGAGATRNGQRLSVSDCQQLDQAMVVVSFSPGVQAESPEIARFLRVVGQAQAVRRLGSAALNLCYLAAGQLDAYWATSVNEWDIAAGVLMVQEAGGTVTAIDGKPLELKDPRFLACATESLHRQLAVLM